MSPRTVFSLLLVLASAAYGIVRARDFPTGLHKPMVRRSRPFPVTLSPS
jgi:hypothetical protein